MRTRTLKQLTGVVLASLAVAGVSAAAVNFFNYPNFPLPAAARALIATGPAVPLEPNQILIEGYVLDSKRGQPIASAAVFPGAFNQLAAEIPDSLAVTDENGFFSIVVDRDRFTHLAVICHVPKGKALSAGRVGRIELPRADVAQAERTVRLNLPRRDHRCEYPIELRQGVFLSN